MTHPSDSACLWCGHPFRARRTGSPKRFCSAAHRIEFWSALRRWAERAVAAGALTVDQIRNAARACTLASRGVLGGYSPHAAVEDGKPTPASVARPETAGAEQLLKEFLVALLEEPSPFDEADEGDTLWSVIAAELPDELYERLTCWLMARSSGGG